MAHAKPQSEPPVLIAIPYNIYAAATQQPNNFFDAEDRLLPSQGKAHSWLIFTGASASQNVRFAEHGREMHHGLLAVGAEGAAHDEHARANLFSNDASNPLTVSWEQGHRIKMLATTVEAESAEALAAQFPAAQVAVMDSTQSLQSACDQLQVQQRLGALFSEHARGRHA